MLVCVLKMSNENMKIIHKESERLFLKAQERGFSGKKSSIKEREKLAKRFIREKALFQLLFI